MLKLCLQLLVCLTIVLRCLALIGHFRRVWLADQPSRDRLSAEFRQELRRRGLLISPPLHQPD